MKIRVLSESYQDYGSQEEIDLAGKCLDTDRVMLVGLKNTDVSDEHKKYLGQFYGYAEINVNNKDYYVPVCATRGKFFLGCNGKIWDFIVKSEYDEVMEYIESNLILDLTKKTATFMVKPGRGRGYRYEYRFNADDRKELYDPKTGKVLQTY